MNIVITGSTKGIGFGMARQFLIRGHDVMVSSRHVEAVDQVVGRLKTEYPQRTISGQSCDVSNYDDVQTLWDKSVEALGSVDIWVNNAGRDGLKVPFFALPKADYLQTISTNIIGLMHCNRVVIPGMYEQGGGAIWNMEGFGSNGQTRPGAAVYGSTKYALKYFTQSVSEELKDTPVRVCFLSPGIVVTDMLVPPPDKRGEAWEQVKKILNVLADTVDTVTPFLVDGMLNAKENGAAVRWLTPGKIRWRFLMNVFKKRDVFTPLGL